jgi:hypothetical protein
MNTMKVKTSELTGPALDWAVAVADNLLPKHISLNTDLTHPLVLDGIQAYGPSFIWSQGGPIIECERIDLLGMVKGEAGPWTACLRKKDEAPPWRHITEGPTPLIAAMRCFVASKLGDEIEIPEELQ